jgi:hypothetical protein
MHSYVFGFFSFLCGFVLMLVSLFNWWSDVIMEATFEGEHTSMVEATYITVLLFSLFLNYFFSLLSFGLMHILVLIRILILLYLASC